MIRVLENIIFLLTLFVIWCIVLGMGLSSGVLLLFGFGGFLLALLAWFIKQLLNEEG